MRAALIALLSALAVAAAGCGSEDVAPGAGDAAALLKPGAIVYWTTVSDPDSEQWKQVEELLRRFPDGDQWVAELRKEVESDSEVTWPEVREQLGDEVVVAVYGRSGASEPFVVGLTKPDDPDEAVALVKRIDAEEEGDPAVTRIVDGWLALSDSEAALDAALKGEGGEALADSAAFSDAFEQLPDDALSRVYVSPAAALEAFGGGDREARDAFRMLGFDQLDFAGGWAKAKEEGAELAFTLRGEGADRLLGTADPYSSALLDRAPSDAFAFVSFRGEGAKRQFDELADNPLYSMGLRELETELGVKVADLVALFDGEVAFYAAPGSPIPELTLLLESEDPEAGATSAARLLRAVAERGGGEVTEEDGVTTAVFEGVSVNVGTVDGAVAVSTAKDAFLDGGGDGDGLAGSDRFEDALDAAGVPEQYTGLAYVDLGRAIEMAMGYAGVSGEQVPPELSRNLEPLRSLVSYADEDGEVATSLVFVGIE